MITARHFRSNVARVHHPWGTHCVMPFKVTGVGVRSHDKKGSARVVQLVQSRGVC